MLREVEKRTGIIGQFAVCFRDPRDRARVEPPVAELVAQRVDGRALGYEDRNDQEELRRDPRLAVWVEKLELTGAEVSAEEGSKKIALEEAAVDRRLVEVLL